MFNKYVVKQTQWVPPAATPRLQIISLMYSGFLTRLSQSVVFDNFALTILLEVYYAVISLSFRVTLYERFRVISRLVKNGTTRIMCWDIAPEESTLSPRSQDQRPLHVSSLATIFETAYESACFHYFFVLRFICYPPPNMSVVAAACLFVVCKAIQVLNDALTAYVVFKYEGIVLMEYATKLKSEVFFWWDTLMTAALVFIGITGSMWDPAIKPMF